MFKKKVIKSLTKKKLSALPKEAAFDTGDKMPFPRSLQTLGTGS
jgi:hypothetical protein